MLRRLEFRSPLLLYTHLFRPESLVDDVGASFHRSGELSSLNISQLLCLHRLALLINFDHPLLPQIINNHHVLIVHTLGVFLLKLFELSHIWIGEFHVENCIFHLLHSGFAITLYQHLLKRLLLLIFKLSHIVLSVQRDRLVVAKDVLALGTDTSQAKL